MLLHFLEFFPVQFSRLVQDVLLDKDLTDVMKQGCVAQLTKFLTFHSQGDPDDDGQYGYVDRVVIGIVVKDLHVHHVDHQFFPGQNLFNDFLHHGFGADDLLVGRLSPVFRLDEYIPDPLHHLGFDGFTDQIQDRNVFGNIVIDIDSIVFKPPNGL